MYQIPVLKSGENIRNSSVSVYESGGQQKKKKYDFFEKVDAVANKR